jgi:Tol biopolymer transport system component
MRRRSFLVAAGAAAVSNWKGSGQTSLGTIVWVRPDGIWIGDLPDGQPFKILPGSGFHDPRFSPEGGTIWYKQDDEDRAVRLDGTPVENRVAAGHVVSPDGNEFAAVDSDGETVLYTALATKPDEKSKLRTVEQEDIQLFAWTRDSKSLIYWRAECSGSVWSDGVDLYSIPASGGPGRKLGITSLVHDDLLTLAPKGNLLAVTRGPGRETWTDQRVTIVDLDTGSICDLTAATVAALCPAWSPDGGTIAYTAAPDAGNLGGGERAHQNLHLRQIWMIGMTGGSAPRRLTNDPHYRDEEPMWSRDGSHILFGRMDFNGHPSLWLMKSDGTEARYVCSLKLHDDEDLGTDEHWFGYYGYIDWRSAVGWRR